MIQVRRVFVALAFASLPLLAGCNSKSMPPGATPGPASNGTVYASSDNAGSGAQLAVFAYPIFGNSVPIATLGFGAPTNMNQASEIRADSAGRIWVFNEGVPNITVYKPPLTATSVPVATIVVAGTPGEEYHMTFDNAGNLWVDDAEIGAVVEYNGPWSSVTGTATPAANIVLISGLNLPAGLAFDSSGNLYVANSGAQTVSIFTAPIATGNTPSGTLFLLTGFPDALVMDHSQNLYVGSVSGDIARFNAPIIPGHPPAITDPAATTTASDIRGMAVDAVNDVFVMSCNHNVLEFPTGSLAFSATMAPGASVPFTGCGGVFVQ